MLNISRSYHDRLELDVMVGNCEVSTGTTGCTCPKKCILQTGIQTVKHCVRLQQYCILPLSSRVSSMSNIYNVNLHDYSFTSLITYQLVRLVTNQITFALRLWFTNISFPLTWILKYCSIDFNLIVCK